MPLFKEIQLVQFDPLSERVGRRHLSVQISLFLSFLEWIGYVFSAIGIVIQWYWSIYEWGFMQRRDTHIRYSIQCSKLHFCFYKVPFGSPECWLIKSWCWWTKRQKNLCIMNIDIFSFDLQWMIFKRISVLNLGGIYCEKK